MSTETIIKHLNKPWTGDIVPIGAGSGGIRDLPTGEKWW